MKKFLCYDTNDAASGKINVSPNGVLKPNSTVPSTNGASYQQLVTDGEGKTKWEDRLAYENSRVAVPPEGNNRFIKVADTVPSWLSANKNTKVWVSIKASERVIDISSTGYVINHDGSFMVLQNDSLPYAAVIMEDDCEFNVMSSAAFFPEKGVYFVWDKLGSSLLYTAGIASADSDTPEITWDGNIETIKKLDKKFLPDQTVFRLVNGKLVDEKGNAITSKQVKAVGLDFVIRTPDGVARPITASYHNTYVSFCVAEVGSAGYEFADIRVGTSPD